MIKTAIKLSFVPSIVASLCCAIPIIMYVFGSQVPLPELGRLGKHLYYDYGWYFRGFGLLTLTALFVWHVRADGVLSWSMAKTRQASLLKLAGVSLVFFVIFYIASLATSQYVGELLGIYEVWLTK